MYPSEQVCVGGGDGGGVERWCRMGKGRWWSWCWGGGGFPALCDCVCARCLKHVPRRSEQHAYKLWPGAPRHVQGGGLQGSRCLIVRRQVPTLHRHTCFLEGNRFSITSLHANMLLENVASLSPIPLNPPSTPHLPFSNPTYRPTPSLSPPPPHTHTGRPEAGQLAHGCPGQHHGQQGLIRAQVL